MVVCADNPAALAGLARKLPHYGKYSYVAFKGDEPTNDAKGQWPVLGSHSPDHAFTSMRPFSRPIVLIAMAIGT